LLDDLGASGVEPDLDMHGVSTTAPPYVGHQGLAAYLEDKSIVSAA
jgi:hypothetical protein